MDNYNKITYLVTGDNETTDDMEFTNKKDAIREAKRRGTTDIMIFKGEDGDERAEYIGQLEVEKNTTEANRRTLDNFFSKL